MQARRAHARVDEWLRDGRTEPAPPGVVRHLESCASCARALSDIDRVRGWFEDPGDFLASDSVSAIRFHLQAIARQTPREPVAGERPRERPPRRRAWLAVAAALMGASGLLGAAFVGWFSERPAAGRAEGVGRAFASFEPAYAGVRRAASGADELYLLDDGEAHFSVTPVPTGQRVIVQVGSDRVIVQGTRFDVKARQGRLSAVGVQEGVVVLELFAQEPVRLAAGQHWHAEQPEARGPEAPVERRLGARELSPGVAPAPREPPAPSRGRSRSQAPRSLRQHRVASAAQATGTHAEPGARAMDVAFGAAWDLYRADRYDAASLAFEKLLDGELGERRPDVLFWSARMHLLCGRAERAAAQYRELLGAYPDTWHATEARAELRRATKEIAKGRSGSAAKGQSW